MKFVIFFQDKGYMDYCTYGKWIGTLWMFHKSIMQSLKGPEKSIDGFVNIIAEPSNPICSWVPNGLYKLNKNETIENAFCPILSVMETVALLLGRTI